MSRDLQRLARAARTPAPVPPPMRMTDFHDDLTAVLAARDELGPDADPTLVKSFVDQIGFVIDRRVEARLAQANITRKPDQGAITGMFFASAALAIPLLAISGGIVGPVGMLAVVLTIILLNMIAIFRR